MRIDQIKPIIVAGFAFVSLCGAPVGGASSAAAFGLGQVYPLAPLAASSSYALPVNAAVADPAELKAAENFVTSVSANAIAFLSDADLSASGKAKKFEILLDRHFDLETMGKYALGRYWRVATSSERVEYNDLFQNMIIDLYSQRFSEYSDQRVEVVGAMQKGKNVLVHSKIVDPAGSNVKLDWVVKRKNGEYRVIDVLVEGVSMVITQRSDFASVIQRGGGQVQVLIDHLKP